ncbi:MAG TPA: class I SAM-dependent methyltransferase [Stellaceae bacterium]|nr:class I SAM-dependent methyltransferase [Stellaceae bacterium]
MTLLDTAPAAPSLAAIKSKQQAAWSAGNYAIVGTTLQIVGETLCEAIDLRAGQAVLDVAAGNGNAALAAARRWAVVTASDYVPALLDQARARAAADGLEMTLREADAEDLPFADASFDAVLSTFGVMFTPDQEKAASELLRVTRPGGKIGLASWTPASFIGRLFRTIGAHIPPAPGVKSPALWGTEQRLLELLGAGAKDIVASRRQFVFRYLSAEHWLEVFRTFYGPLNRAFAALGERGPELERDVLALIAEFDRGAGKGLVLPSEYLEAVIVRK